MRIGLGVVSGENEVTFVLRGPGVHLLDADTDELVDGDDIAKFRGNLKALGIPFHVEETAVPADPDWNADGHPIVPVSLERIADLVRQSRRGRSEEHTSELQSQSKLVCRLLLEKKKNK